MYDHPGIIGWAAILAFAAAFDCYVIAKGKQSLSQAIWESRNTVMGPVVAGAWASLTYHFFFERKFI